MSIFQLCYLSRATILFATTDLMALLEQSREDNHASGITGLLLHDNGSFVQLLEGEPAAVRRLFNGIQDDPRHTDVQVLFQASVDQRTFPEWEMGFCDPRHDMLKDLPGYSTFFSKDFALQDFRRGAKARLFFIQFRDLWRQRLELHPINAFSTARV